MQVIHSNRIIFFDVDQTLVKWDLKDGEEIIEVTVEDYKYKNYKGESEIFPGFTQRVNPHKVHIRRLIEHKKAGDTVVVWTQGGADWGEAVIKSFETRRVCRFSYIKPTCIYDDLPTSDFIPFRLYYEDK